MKTLSDEEMEAVVAALAEGRKIEAIKIYREATDKGLKDAKEFIDALIPKLVEKDPEKYEQIAKSGGGCSSLIVFTLLILAAGAVALQA
ncbi:MAG: ribosomal protein L7/L12 [Verrucomicrobiota bacterium]